MGDPAARAGVFDSGSEEAICGRDPDGWSCRITGLRERGRRLYLGAPYRCVELPDWWRRLFSRGAPASAELLDRGMKGAVFWGSCCCAWLPDRGRERLFLGELSLADELPDRGREGALSGRSPTVRRC